MRKIFIHINEYFLNTKKIVNGKKQKIKYNQKNKNMNKFTINYHFTTTTIHSYL